MTLKCRKFIYNKMTLVWIAIAVLYLLMFSTSRGTVLELREKVEELEQRIDEMEFYDNEIGHDEEDIL